MDTELAHEFARRALDLLGAILSAEDLIQHTVGTFADLFERTEGDVLDTMRSRYVNLADPQVANPADLVRIAGMFGLGPEPGMATEVFRERLRLFIQAYLQGAGTPRSILTMAAAELGVLLGGPVHRYGTDWIQPVRRQGTPTGVIRLQENPLYRVEKQPVLAKTGIRWSIDSPGAAGIDLVYPQVTIEALVDDVRGPSIIFEDIGLAWLSPSVVLNRGDRLLFDASTGGLFSAWKHSNHRVEEVTDRIQLLGQVPDENALDEGIRLVGGTKERPACAFVKSAAHAHVVRLCARSTGQWGNGLQLRRERVGRGYRLLVEFDASYAVNQITGDSPVSQWSIPVEKNALETMLDTFKHGEFLLEAQQATLFLPTGRSHWMYLDHLAVLTEDGDLKDLARLLLDYTRYGQSVHHNTDTYDVFRFDRDETLFDDASFTVEEERVKITYSWLEPKATAIQLEVPRWIESEANIAIRNRTYQRLSEGVLRIKPAGVAVSMIRSLPDELLPVDDVFPEDIFLDTTVHIGASVPMASDHGHVEHMSVSPVMGLGYTLGETALTVADEGQLVASPEQSITLTSTPGIALPLTDEGLSVTEEASLTPDVEESLEVSGFAHAVVTRTARIDAAVQRTLDLPLHDEAISVKDEANPTPVAQDRLDVSESVDAAVSRTTRIGAAEQGTIGPQVQSVLSARDTPGHVMDVQNELTLQSTSTVNIARVETLSTSEVTAPAIHKTLDDERLSVAGVSAVDESLDEKLLIEETVDKEISTP